MSVSIKKKNILLKETGSACIYCGAPLTIKTFTLDHIRPKAAGFDSSSENAVACCQICNNDKASRGTMEYVATMPLAQRIRYRIRVRRLMKSGILPSFKGRLLLSRHEIHQSDNCDARIPARWMRKLCRETNCKCMYCGNPITEETRCVDKIVPTEIGGIDNLDNLVLCCPSCKKSKQEVGLSTFKASMPEAQRKALHKRIRGMVIYGHISREKALNLLPHSQDVLKLRRQRCLRIGRMKIIIKWDKK